MHLHNHIHIPIAALNPNADTALYVHMQTLLK